MNIDARAWLPSVGIPILAVLAGFAVGAVVIFGVGQSPIAVYRTLFAGCFGNAFGFGQVVFQATTLVFTGLAVAVCFRAGLFNIGAEGQLYVGAFVMTVVGLLLPEGVPAVVAVPLLLVTAMAAGGLWGALAGALKAWRGAHEVIATVMLNFVALGLVGWAMRYFTVPETVRTEHLPDAARLPRLGDAVGLFPNSMANVSVVVAALALVAVWYLVERTRFGFELRAVGANPDAAEAAGIPVARVRVLAMALGGALAALASGNLVLGADGYFQRDFTGGVGFLGIAVALLASSRPAGLPLAALLFGVLGHGGLVISSRVPRETTDIIAGVVLLSAIVGLVLARRWAAKAGRGKTPAEGAPAAQDP